MTGHSTLSERLEATPHRFGGLQAIRLAELGPALAGDEAAGPTRIVAERGLRLASAPVVSVKGDAEGTRVRSAFLGLTGPLGVLPQVYSEMVQRAERLRNMALPAFLDLFNHRLTTLFLRASEKYRLSVLVQRTVTDWPAQRSPERGLELGTERTEALPAGAGRVAARIGTDPVSRAMLALAGLGTPHLRGRMEIADEVVLYYAGLFSARTRPATSLEAMLADYLQMDVKVEQFAGRWLPVSEAEQTRLPRPGEPPQYCALGVDAVAGARVWDVQSAFRVVVGPVQYEEMLDLMPDQPLLRRLVDLVRVYAGTDLLFEVQVVLHRDAVPELMMDASSGQAAPKLGWNTWAKSLPALEHKWDIILDPDVVMRQHGRPRAERKEAKPSETRLPARMLNTVVAAASTAAPSARQTR